MENWLMIVVQILSIIFGLFMMYVARIHWLKQHIGVPEFSMWLSIWFIFIFIAIFQQTVGGIAQTFHVGSVFNLLVIIALMILVYLTFTNRIMYQRLEKKLEKIIRKNAIDEKK
jgi:hypothetical protein